MAASDYVSETPEFTLALKGASTDGKRTYAGVAFIRYAACIFAWALSFKTAGSTAAAAMNSSRNGWLDDCGAR